MTSRLTTTTEELTEFLRTRKAYWGKDVIVPDASYERAWTAEPDGMKLVRSRADVVGEWAIFALPKASFERFVEGPGLTHQQILEEHVISWDETRRDGAYLYLAGVTTIPKAGSVARGQVVLDMLAFGAELIRALPVRGIAGYPHESARTTLEMLTRLGLTRSNRLIDGSTRQPICSARTEPALATVATRLARLLRSAARRTPIWERADRTRFLARLERN